MKISCRKKIAVDSKKDAVIIPVYKNIRSLRTITGKKIDDELQNIIQSDYFNFDEKESKSFYIDVNKKLKKIYIIHVPKEKGEARFYMELGAKTASIFKKDKIYSFSLISFEDIYNEKKDLYITKAFLEGFMFNDYTFDKYKSKKSPEHNFEAEVITAMPKLKKYIDDNADNWNAVFDNINIMKDLVNTPANYLKPYDFAEFVKNNLPENIDLTIWDEKEILNNNMNLLHAVGKGSVNKPYFLKLTYNGNKESSNNIALIGKGITFDSGGYSLKPAASMAHMKDDMAGAALMYALTKLIAELNLKINIHTYIPLAENLIGSNSLFVGDVITSASSKTVEILNTDAEGRLIMADALYLATKTDPEIIIDAATLTGACVVALGPYCAGIFSNRKFLSKQISDISYEVAEDVWELPLYADYEQGITSTVADFTNMSTFAREGGAIHAALFLKQFIDNYPWLHIDMAGPAYMEKNHPIFGKEATGFGLRLLFHFLNTHYTEGVNERY